MSEIDEAALREKAEVVLGYGQHAYVRPENVAQRDRITAEFRRHAVEVAELRASLDSAIDHASNGWGLAAKLRADVARLTKERDTAQGLADSYHRSILRQNVEHVTLAERCRALEEALRGATEALDELGVMQDGSPLLALWRKWVALTPSIPGGGA